MFNLSKVMVFLCCLFSLTSISYASGLNKNKLLTKNENTVEKSQSKPLSQLKINLNQANADEISKAFKGIGPKRSQAIVAYREAHGVFKTMKDLSLVKGISKRFIEKNNERLKNIFIL